MSRFLFLDDVHVARLDGLARRPHQAERHPANPVLVSEHPWEASRVQIYGRSVIYDPEAAKFRMYYIASAGPRYPWIKVNGRDLPGHSTLPAYAESDDGVTWTKPILGQRSFNGIANTNLLDFNRGQSFEAAVLHDPRDPDPQRRYKLFYWDQAAQMLPAGKLDYDNWGYDCTCKVKDDAGNVIAEMPYNDWGIDVAFSPDGIHWTRHGAEPVLRCYSDTGQSVHYDPRLGRYVAFGRFNLTRLAGGGLFNVGRSVARVTSDDFVHWSDPELVLTADHGDADHLQINSMPIDLYEGVYIGLMDLFQPGSVHHCSSIQLATSRDGVHWTRVADRFSFLDPARGGWDSLGLKPGSALIARGDRVMMYYCSGRERLEGVGLATWRRDGFVSLRGGADGGELLTTAFVAAGRELHLNIDAARGEARVQLCNPQGLPTDDGPTATIRDVDSTDLTVRWEQGDFASRLGGYLSLRISLTNADLYSFRFI